MECPHEYGFCDEHEIPDFLDLMKSELTHLKNGRHSVGTVNDEAISALCGFPNIVLRFIWFKYGRCLLSHGCTPIDFMWTLSHLNLYDSDIVVGLLWGEKKTTFETTAKRNVRLLFDVLQEVRNHIHSLHAVINLVNYDSSPKINEDERLKHIPGPDSIFANVTYAVDVVECPIARPVSSDLENATHSHKKASNTLKYESTPFLSKFIFDCLAAHREFLLRAVV